MSDLENCKCCERVWGLWGAAGKAGTDSSVPERFCGWERSVEGTEKSVPAFPTCVEKRAKTESGKEGGNGGGNWESRGFVEFIWFVFAELEGMMVWRLEMD